MDHTDALLSAIDDFLVESAAAASIGVSGTYRERKPGERLVVDFFDPKSPRKATYVITVEKVEAED